MGLQIDLHAKLKEYFGFDNFKGNQEQIIKNVLAGNNTFVLMPTGGGKTARSHSGRDSDCNLSADCFNEKPGGCNALL